MLLWLGIALVCALVVSAWFVTRRAPLPHFEAGLELPEGEVIVLVHGFMGFSTIGIGRRGRVTYFRGIARRLEDAGYTVYSPSLPMVASVPARAEELAEFVRSLPHEQVTIFAHSMGGLDSRYAIAKLGLAARVARLVTIGTPHRGTPMADLYHLGSGPIRWLASLFRIRFDALEWLTTARMATFSEEVPDSPEVSYYSVISHTRSARLLPNLSLVFGHWYLRVKGGPNDGLVPTDSQRWGTCLLEMEAHHWDQVGWAYRSHAPFVYERLARSKARPEDR